jgi:hypothetical protein
MALYKVLSKIEHNLVQFWPEQDSVPPATAPSFGHGQSVPVDASGQVELTEAEAAPLLKSGALAAIKQAAAKGVLEQVEEFVEEEVEKVIGRKKKA